MTKSIRTRQYRKKSGEISTYFQISETTAYGSFKTRAEAEKELGRLELEADMARRREPERDAAEGEG